MTVCGVPYYSCNEVEILMGNADSVNYLANVDWLL